MGGGEGGRERKALGLTQVRERAEEPGDDDGDVWHAVLVGAAEDLGELVVRRHGHNHAASYPAVGVAGLILAIYTWIAV